MRGIHLPSEIGTAPKRAVFFSHLVETGRHEYCFGIRLSTKAGRVHSFSAHVDSESHRLNFPLSAPMRESSYPSELRSLVTQGDLMSQNPHDGDRLCHAKYEKNKHVLPLSL